MLANGFDFRPYVVNDQLQMEAILSRFREFIERRGREAFKVTPMPQEATGQYLLMAYLDIVVRQIGAAAFTEVNSGEGRLDLVVVHKGQRTIIETKIWRGQALYEEGLLQLADYLQARGKPPATMCSFMPAPRSTANCPMKRWSTPRRSLVRRSMSIWCAWVISLPMETEKRDLLRQNYIQMLIASGVRGEEFASALAAIERVDRRLATSDHVKSKVALEQRTQAHLRGWAASRNLDDDTLSEDEWQNQLQQAITTVRRSALP